MAEVFLTRRALADLEDIARYSTEMWGERVANEYLDDIDAALERLAAHPALLREVDPMFESLRFYRVRKHFLICEILGGDVYVLAVHHGGMDLPSRLAELEPLLAEEARLMRRRVMQGRKERGR